jgi:hypothetical protein
LDTLLHSKMCHICVNMFYPTFAHVYPYGMSRENDEMFTFTVTLQIR